MADLARNPEALSAIVESFGGTPIPHRTFRFEIELGESRKVVAEINRLGLRCEKVGERQDTDRNGHACSIATVEIRRPPAKTEYDDIRHLMWATQR